MCCRSEEAGQLSLKSEEYYRPATEMGSESSFIPLWMQSGCMNSLKELHKFYCKKELDKSAVEIFIDAKTLNEIRSSFDVSMAGLYLCKLACGHRVV